ncbi:hypothetical protein J3R30DRAFT_3401597 [Lentinula aciculospora]|uniref:Uncharacterized protein n=1 Tax=Lentinula aciculospora TaxID=153920 RepID=A0A9W9DUN7_9AGAR|nr:hypothetical protein J3R30DRAFT_3401597 [Lentinula aciculospora]
MSSGPPSRSDSSRNWWSKSSKGSVREPSPYTPEKPGRASSSKRNDNTKFNTLASAFGLKAKKHPSLAIQDPPVPSFFSHSEPPYSSDSLPKYTNRPPSKSVSSIKSRADSIEPRTPLDGQRDPASNRHSLLTLSDIDPFAARSGIPRSPIDPNRLSAYSGSSVVPEYITKRLDDVPLVASRVSYASSSSHSFSPDDMSSLSPTSSLYVAEKPYKKLSQKKSLGDLGQRSTRSNHLDSFPPGMIKSNSSVTLTDKNRFSHPEIPSISRPPMRARGMTDAAAIPRQPHFLQDSATNTALFSPPYSLNPPPPSPRVVIRQPSIQKMGLPISAPPSDRLPPPPVPVDVTDDEDVDPLRFSNSASSSTTSFKSSRDTSMINKHYVSRPQPREREFWPVEDTVHKSRTLKKAISHQSLSKGSSSNASTVLPLELAPEKGPRKQRSFHHPLIPLPQMPLSLKHQSSGSAVSHFDRPESKRGSMNGPPTPSRKRLFSGSSTRRPSTSQETFVDDDHRSVFSLDREKQTPISPISTKLSSKSSFWDEGSADATPSSPHTSTMEYTPQQIMSPADMEKLEADVRESLSSSRSRGMSIISTSTTTSEPDNASSLPSLMGSLRSHGLLNPQPHPIRSNSMGSGGAVVNPRLPRPSTGHSIASQTASNDIPSPGFVSLPPPPRFRRAQPALGVPEAPLKALSPPPRTRAITKTASIEKLNRRPPMTRKSSFLDIDGEPVVKKPSPPPVPLHGGDSFLDLARESLDTVRSDTDEERF